MTCLSYLISFLFDPLKIHPLSNNILQYAFHLQVCSLPCNQSPLLKTVDYLNIEDQRLPSIHLPIDATSDPIEI